MCFIRQLTLFVGRFGDGRYEGPPIWIGLAQTVDDVETWCLVIAQPGTGRFLTESDEIFYIAPLKLFERLLSNEPGPEQQSFHIPTVAGKGTQAASVGLQKLAGHVEVVPLRGCQVLRCSGILKVLDGIETGRR